MKGWSKACKAAGLDGLLFHDLRRSAVRNMERAGIPRNIAMAISSHKTEAVYRRYDIVAPGDLEVAAAKLERYFQNQKGATSNSKSKIRVRRAALGTFRIATK
jgi:integrase